MTTSPPSREHAAALPARRRAGVRRMTRWLIVALLVLTTLAVGERIGLAGAIGTGHRGVAATPSHPGSDDAVRYGRADHQPDHRAEAVTRAADIAREQQLTGCWHHAHRRHLDPARCSSR